jgi:Lysophospholipase
MNARRTGAVVNIPTALTSDKYLKTPDGALLRYKMWRPLTHSDIKPRIVLLQGRATFIEKVDHIIEHLRLQGFEVWTFDWRGQGLSTREVGRRGYIKNYDQYLSDLNLFVRKFLKNDLNKRPVIFLGHSMGGHIGLRYMAENPGVISGAVMTAPMLDINTGICSKKMARILSRGLSYLGFGKSYVFGHGDYNPVTEPFEGNLLTRSQEMFYHHRQQQMELPEAVLGGATFGWVAATCKSIDILMNKAYLSRIQEPVKIYIAGDDRVVDNARLQEVCSWLPCCEVEIFEGARHQLLSEVEEIQHHIYEGIDQFATMHFELPIVDRELREVVVAKREPVAELTPIAIKEEA